MRAVSRVGMAMVAAGLMLGPVPAFTQSVPDTATNTPATDAVGPRELQNFSLNGTVTKAADTPAAPARSRTQPARPTADRAATAVASDAPTPSPSRVSNPRGAAAPAPAPQPSPGQS